MCLGVFVLLLLLFGGYFVRFLISIIDTLQTKVLFLLIDWHKEQYYYDQLYINHYIYLLKIFLKVLFPFLYCVAMWFCNVQNRETIRTLCLLIAGSKTQALGLLSLFLRCFSPFFLFFLVPVQEPCSAGSCQPFRWGRGGHRELKRAWGAEAAEAGVVHGLRR